MIAGYPAISVLRPSSGKSVFMVVGSVAFVLCGWWMILSGKGFGWLAVIFFGVCGVVGLIRLLPGAFGLVVMKEGLALRSFFRTRFYEWDRIEGFGVFTAHHQEMVMFNEVTGKSQGLAILTQALSGYAHYLPDCYGYEAQQLAGLLNKYRLEALADQASRDEKSKADGD